MNIKQAPQDRWTGMGKGWREERERGREGKWKEGNVMERGAFWLLTVYNYTTV